MKAMNYLISVCLIVAFSCNQIQDLAVHTEYAKGTDFKQFKSYKFMEELSYSDKSDNYSSENIRSMEIAIHDRMKAKGLEETETPDLLVNIYVVDQHKAKAITNTSYRGQKYGGLTHVDTYIKEYDQGTLVIDLVDADNNKLVWQGVAKGIIDENQANAQATINEAVAAVLANYPPSS